MSSPMIDVSTSTSEMAAPPGSRSAGNPVLVCVPSATADTLQTVRSNLVAALPGEDILLASADIAQDAEVSEDGVRTVEYPPQTSPHAGWILSAADYLAAATLGREHHAVVTLLLGPEAGSLSSVALRALVAAVAEGADLALPRYHTGPHEGLVNASLLYPLSRSLFGVEARIPLPLDTAFSARTAARFSMAAKRPASGASTEPLLWPAAEASVASLSVREVHAGERMLPHPSITDLNTLLAQIAGSLFTDLEAKAAFWQRARTITPPVVQPLAATAASHIGEEDLAEVRSMAEVFRNAYLNLQEIWSLIVPPQSLLALKKLSLSPAETFTMPPNLWARLVYDFVLAYRLRTINRGHLLGALTPLYLGWVASHLRRADDDPILAEQHIEETAAAFIAERPYVLARWRWPDRFNP